MRRFIVMYGEGFSDSELEEVKTMLEKNMENFEDVTVLVTNKDFKYRQLSDEAWSELEKAVEKP
jgi:hypothetical protein|tara:strand:+ start:51 stop:242 length:192 start_codon:yes stop_codon:yes gene_type:complete